MITAHRHRLPANTGKAEALVALFPAFREALGGLGSLTRREVLNGEPLSGWRVMSKDSLPFPHRVSARQMKSVQNMTRRGVGLAAIPGRSCAGVDHRLELARAA
jgi:putative transposase